MKKPPATREFARLQCRAGCGCPIHRAAFERADGRSKLIIAFAFAFEFYFSRFQPKNRMSSPQTT